MPSTTSGRLTVDIGPHGQGAAHPRWHAAPQRVYRDRTGRRVAARRPLYLTDYLPPDEMDLDDDNDSLESMVDPSDAVEGAPSVITK